MFCPPLWADESSAEVSLVVQNAGLWPQLHVATDGSLLAFGYNAPAHTTLPADIDCWASSDGGRQWEKRSAAARRPAEHANYCHWASGRGRDGASIVVASGMDHAADTTGLRSPNDVVVFRSTDSGRTWNRHGNFPRLIHERLKPYPFGSIADGPGGTLRMLGYTVDETAGNLETSWMFVSRDDGRTWGEPRKVGDGINESAVISIGASGWLCIGRTSDQPAPAYGQALRQARSDDDGLTWWDEGLIAEYHRHPPHLLRLRDGRITLTYCDRRDGTIVARQSDNQGRTWTEPRELFRTGPGDRGYPSTAELPDGTCVTVFYAKSSSVHEGYHMGAIRWRPAVK
jgi:Neuraminidase (sialidase)